jgi:hypothetical protein
VRRGAATGCNRFFVLSEEGRKLHRIAVCSVLPCLTSPSQMMMTEVTLDSLEALPDSTPRWLLFPRRPHAVGPLADYLRLGQDSLGVLDRYLVQIRKRAHRPWYQVEIDFDAPIVMTYFNRGDVRFVRNRARAVPLNNWLAIQPLEGVDSEALLAVLRGPGISKALRRDAREYGNGLWKAEPSEVMALRHPTFREVETD